MTNLFIHVGKKSPPQWSRALATSVEGRGFKSPVGSCQKLKNWHLLLPWLAFTI